MDHNRRAEVLSQVRPERWVVLSEDEDSVVVESETFTGATEEAASRGIDDPVVLLVPPDWSARIFGAV